MSACFFPKFDDAYDSNSFETLSTPRNALYSNGFFLCFQKEKKQRTEKEEKEDESLKEELTELLSAEESVRYQIENIEGTISHFRNTISQISWKRFKSIEIFLISEVWTSEVTFGLVRIFLDSPKER